MHVQQQACRSYNSYEGYIWKLVVNRRVCPGTKYASPDSLAHCSRCTKDIVFSGTDKPSRMSPISALILPSQLTFGEAAVWQLAVSVLERNQAQRGRQNV